MSMPIPSPSTNGMMGSSGTLRAPSEPKVILEAMYTEATAGQPEAVQSTSAWASSNTSWRRSRTNPEKRLIWGRVIRPSGG